MSVATPSLGRLPVSSAAVQKMGAVLALAALSRAMGLSKTALYTVIRRESPPSDERSAAVHEALARAGMRLVAASSAERGPTPAPTSVVTLAALQRASGLLMQGPLCRHSGLASSALKSRLRRGQPELSESESVQVARGLASAGLELVLQPGEAESAQVRWLEDAERERTQTPPKPQPTVGTGHERWTAGAMLTLRRRLGYSQPQMTRALGFRSVSSVCALENGQARLPGPVARLLDHLDARGDLAPHETGSESPDP